MVHTDADVNSAWGLCRAAALPLVFRVLNEKNKEQRCESKSSWISQPSCLGCEYQVLVFKYCGHSDFYFCPRGTLWSEPQGDDGAGGGDEAHTPNPRTDRSTQRGPGTS